MRFLATLFSLLFVLALVAIGGVAFVAWHLSQGLPEYSQLADYRPPVATRIHAGDGKLLAEFAEEKRVFVPYEAIPKRVVRAFISAEDQNFFEHEGVDWIAVVRAVAGYPVSKLQGRRPVGASTITQQVTRHFLLSNEVSFERKFREWLLAYRMEQAMGKERILELYLNEIFLGNRAYGVAAAALNYFGKSLDELTIAEAAFLASLPKAPDRYYRERFRDAAVARRDYVIGRMLEDGHITPAEADAARAEPIAFREVAESQMVNADYFVEEVRRELAGIYGEDALYKGGLSVRTTLNPDIQTHARTALREGLAAYDRRQGYRGPVTRLDGFDGWREKLAAIRPPAGAEDWLLAIVLETTAEEARIGTADGRRGHIALADLKWARRADADGTYTGPSVRQPADAITLGDVVLVQPKAQVRRDAAGEDDVPDEAQASAKAEWAEAYVLRQIPMVQGALVAMDPHTGRVLAMVGGFSADISVFNRATQARRQPGSAFKPFVYLPALDAGFTPSSLVLDAPFVLDQGAGLGKWRPANYTDRFYGPTPLRVGIEKSRNVMTVRLAQYIGMEPVVEAARKFGITENLPPQLSMALGAGETTVLRMTTAYGMLVNGGKRITPTVIDRIQDRGGRTIFRHDNRDCTGCTGISWPGVESTGDSFAAARLRASGAAPTPTPAPIEAPAAEAAVTGMGGLPADPTAVPLVPDGREQIADPRTVYQIVSMLEGVVQRGTAVRLKAIGKPLAGKTGTTNDSNDVWFMGFTPDLVVGIFVGYDQPRSLGDRESGSSVAVPIAKAFFTDALKDAPAIPFRVPPGVRLVRVDPETGRLAGPGQRGAIWEAFIPGTEPRGDEAVLDGGDQGATFVPTTDQPQQPPPTTLGTGTGGVY